MQPGSSLNQSKQETLTLNFEEVKYGAQSRLCLYPSGAVHRYNSRACRLSVCALALFLSQTQACVSVSNLSTNGLHQILGEVHRPPRQGMRSSADSLDKKRFIGEQHRGELERRDGRGEERRAEQRSAAPRTPQSSDTLTWQLGHGEEFQPARLFVLIPTCTTCF